MSLTEKQIQLVTDSWSKVAPISQQAAELFYNRLFELDPALRPLFKGNISEQGAKLMKTLGVAVASLTNLEALVPVLKTMGKQHEEYGVEASHYQTVAEALLWTLEQGLGDDFTEEVKEAWTATYVIVADTMLSGCEVPA
ncbi:hemin receptor [Endozoicomonas sp. OPT23]|uniref:globin family protein n=1 Tax=Endozoicomonas sp. OPT23 TaxID=2072845 RepID=UPI00129AF15D|nr:globin family protein [Endozoicomonas sp. OPT23]MRI33092.1 hemin receptor [Endozoicomonas sp. OPT23]